jgi:hypothetical protein
MRIDSGDASATSAAQTTGIKGSDITSEGETSKTNGTPAAGANHSMSIGQPNKVKRQHDTTQHSSTPRHISEAAEAGMRSNSGTTSARARGQDIGSNSTSPASATVTHHQQGDGIERQQRQRHIINDLEGKHGRQRHISNDLEVGSSGTSSTISRESRGGSGTPSTI